MITYKEKKFYKLKNGYYSSFRRNPETKEALLHRHVWVDNHGPIPKGYSIHHIDKDRSNNNISNLELISLKRHLTTHSRELWKNEDYRKKAIEALQKAQIEATKWHKSEQGLAWHKEHGKNTWIDRKTIQMNCSVCGKKIKAWFKTRKRYCSRICEQKDYYKNNRVTRVCFKCGKEYSCYKYKEQQFCSYKCSNSSRSPSTYLKAIMIRAANKKKKQSS